MARRAKSNIGLILLLALVLLLIVGVVGATFFLRNAGQAFANAEPLDATLYLENANSLRGNVYKLEGEILNALAWSPSEGRLYSVGVDRNREVVPVLIPNEFNKVNIQKGQKFVILVEVTDRGMLRAKDLSKS